MRRFHDIAPYAVTEFRLGYTVWLDGDLLETGFPSDADAYGHAHDLRDTAEAEAAAAVDFEAQRFLEAA